MYSNFFFTSDVHSIVLSSLMVETVSATQELVADPESRALGGPDIDLSNSVMYIYFLVLSVSFYAQ